MTVELMLTPAFFAHFSRILMLDSMMGWPPWQMLSVSAACARGESAITAASAPMSAQPIPRRMVMLVLPRDALRRLTGAGLGGSLLSRGWRGKGEVTSRCRAPRRDFPP